MAITLNGTSNQILGVPGQVLQVVQAGSNGGSTTSTSLVDMGLSASITPTSSTSKILVYINGTARLNAAMRAGFAIIRGSSNIRGQNELVGNGASVVSYIPYFLSILDSPATTSSTTYKVQFVTDGSQMNTNDGGANYAGFLNYITLMEISA